MEEPGLRFSGSPDHLAVGLVNGVFARAPKLRGIIAGTQGADSLARLVERVPETEWLQAVIATMLSIGRELVATHLTPEGKAALDERIDDRVDELLGHGAGNPWTSELDEIAEGIREDLPVIDRRFPLKDSTSRMNLAVGLAVAGLWEAERRTVKTLTIEELVAIGGVGSACNLAVHGVLEEI